MDKIKANLESIGYEVFDSAGLVKDSVFESLDPATIKDWLEAHVVVDATQQTIDTAKQHKDWLLEDIKDYAAQSQDFSTKILNKGREYYADQSKEASNYLWSKWSDSKLKEFLDARGVPVPQKYTRDQLVALVARSKYNSPINFNGPSGKYWFDSWTRDELVKKLQSVGESIEGTRKELSERVYSSYSKAYDLGKKQGGQTADSVKETVDGWKEATADSFQSWSIDDLKDYLAEFGSEVSGTKDSLVSAAKSNYYYFVHGKEPPKTITQHITHHLYGLRSRFQSYFSKLFGIQSFLRSDL
ncbi:hypothetical protein EGM85_11665 [Macrococcus caseolyticus]|nr:hypothetical protein [Macrococcus caseolyticus]RKO10917.1 hypothetical protein D6861_11665 [Macrococcus caseolyticus]